jgi:hypothetical protein
MVTGIGGVDRDDGHVRQVLARTEIELRHALGFLGDAVRELVRDAMLVDRDQAEAARREGIAEHFRDTRA